MFLARKRHINAPAKEGYDTRLLHGHRSIQHTVRYTELPPTRFKDFWSATHQNRTAPSETFPPACGRRGLCVLERRL
jgi:hypothetical protein